MNGPNRPFLVQSCQYNQLFNLCTYFSKIITFKIKSDYGGNNVSKKCSKLNHVECTYATAWMLELQHAGYRVTDPPNPYYNKDVIFCDAGHNISK